MTRDEQEKALLGAVILAASAYVLAQLGRAGGWPWDWDLFGSGEGPRDGKPGDASKSAPKGSPTQPASSSSEPVKGPSRPGTPGVIDVYDPDIQLPDGRVVSGATYRRMLNEGYRP